MLAKASLRRSCPKRWFERQGLDRTQTSLSGIRCGHWSSRKVARSSSSYTAATSIESQSSERAADEDSVMMPYKIEGDMEPVGDQGTPI